MQSEALKFEAQAEVQADTNMELGFIELENRGSEDEDERQKEDFSEDSANDFADSASSGKLRIAADQEFSESEDDE